MFHGSRLYHRVLDLLDAQQVRKAASEFFEVAPGLTSEEFYLLLNAFIRRGITVASR
jgi:hypothetical protein